MYAILSASPMQLRYAFFFQLQEGNWLMTVIRRIWPLKVHILIHHAIVGSGVLAAHSRRWYVMIMLALIRGYDCFWVCRSPLNMLTHFAPLVCAFIVAPIGK